MTTIIKCKTLRENKHSGLRTVAIPAEGWEIVRAWLESKGLDPKDTVRNYRLNKAGQHTFHCGVGYAVFDADVLGGVGDGKAERAFRDDTGRYLWLV